MAIFALMSSPPASRHLVAALFGLLLMIIAGHFLPGLLLPPPSETPPSIDNQEVALSPVDLRPDSLLTYFGGTIDRRKRGVIPAGPPFPLYAFQISQYLETQHCRSLSFEEIGLTQLKLQYQCFSFEPHEIVIIKSEKLKQGTAQLFLLFEASEMTIPVLNGLNELQIPYSLVIDPMAADSTVEFDLQRLKPKALYLTLHHREMNRRAGRIFDQTIQPQLHEEEIKQRIIPNLKRFTEASGVLLAGKSKSFNYPHIADAVLQSVAEHQAQLLIVSNQSTPTLDSACTRNQGTCLFGEKIADPQAVEKALQSAAAEARKRGSKILVLPLSLETLRAVEKLKEEAEHSGLEFLSLSKQTRVQHAIEGEADEYNTGR